VSVLARTRQLHVLKCFLSSPSDVKERDPSSTTFSSGAGAGAAADCVANEADLSHSDFSISA